MLAILRLSKITCRQVSQVVEKEMQEGLLIKVCEALITLAAEMKQVQGSEWKAFLCDRDVCWLLKFTRPQTYQVCYGHPPCLRPRQRQPPAIVLLVDCHLLRLQIDTGAEARAR